jgi:hypothetical protein
MIRRRGNREEDSSDDDEEDVFSSLSKKPKSNLTTLQQEQKEGGSAAQVPPSVPVVPAITSSMKRHHGMMSNTRKAQMDAVLMDLEREKSAASISTTRSKGFIPDKKGSYVDPEQEHLTTNLFVGNLDPDLTETAITRYFSQFGDLHSVKIMWPRTAEDRARNRVSGFFCYKRRGDANDAMEACSDSDPFHVGRTLKVRWGKSVFEATEDASPPVDSSKRQRSEKSSPGNHYGPAGEDFREKKQNNRRKSRAIDGSSDLEPQDLEEFDTLARRKLCASRRAISEAMAFCFEHGSASTQISQLLKELMLDSHCSIETRISRLYLLSDVLFNSQQPGVKNAFRYRDAIEKMAHDVFYSLGQHGGMSRMTKHKMQTAVRTILSAWTNWSVFDHSFLDELETRFEGREIIKKEPIKIEAVEEKEEVHDAQEPEKETIILAPRGDWVEVNEEEEAARKRDQQERTRPVVGPSAAEEMPQGVDSPDDEDIDGEPLEDGDLDEEGLKRLHEIHQVSDDDGENNSGNYRELRVVKQEDDIDGETLADVDGEPLKQDGEIHHNRIS